MDGIVIFIFFKHSCRFSQCSTKLYRLPPNGWRMPSYLITSNDPQNQATLDPENLELDVIVVNPDELNLFIKLVYLHAIILIVIGSLTWSAVILTDFDFDEFVPVPIYVWVLIMFILLMMFIHIPLLRYIYPINLIITQCCFVFSVLAGIYFVEYIDFIGLIFGIAISTLLLLPLYVHGAFCSQAYLPKVSKTYFVTFLTILGITFIVLLFIENFILDVTYLILCITLNTAGALFQAQYIHGHFDIVPLFDTDAAFLVIYLQFATFLFSFEYLYFKFH